MKNKNFTSYSFDFLNKGQFNKKQLAALDILQYRFIVRSKVGYKKKQLAQDIGIRPESFARTISTLESVTNQKVIIEDKNVVRTINTFNKGSNKAHIQIPSYFIKCHMLQQKDIVVFGYIKALGGAWNDSGYKLYKMINKWFKTNKWDNLVLSYVSVLKALRKLSKLKIIQICKNNFIKRFSDKEIMVTIIKKISVENDLSKLNPDECVKIFKNLNESPPNLDVFLWWTF